MRIAIYHNLPSGGGKRALHEMTRRLAKKHEIDVFSLTSAEHDFGDLRPLVQHHTVSEFVAWPLVRSPFGRVNQAIYAINLLRLRSTQRSVAAQIDQGKYDVVFVHNCRFAQAPPLLEFLATPTAYYCAEPPRVFSEPLHHRLRLQAPSARRKLDRFDPLIKMHRHLALHLDAKNTRTATAVLTNSAFSRENLYRVYGIDAHLCYLGVDLDTFRFLSLPKENFVLSVGGIVPQKGFDFLMRSLAHIDSAKRPRLMIVGNQNNPDERTYLESLALELGVDAQFCNMISDEELVRLYNRALLTVYMPIMEPFGFVPIESMACGTPVVGVREGGVRETVIHEQTGLLADRNPKPFAAAIESLLSDPVRREVYGQQGRDIVAKRWSWDQSVNHLEAELSEIANSASASFK